MGHEATAGFWDKVKDTFDTVVGNDVVHVSEALRAGDKRYKKLFPDIDPDKVSDAGKLLRMMDGEKGAQARALFKKDKADPPAWKKEPGGYDKYRARKEKEGETPMSKQEWSKRYMAASVAARYLQIPLRVVPDYGDEDDTSAAVPRGKEADSSWAKLFPRNSYLNKFFAEKRIPSRMFDVKDSRGVIHSIPNDVVVEFIAQTGSSERRKIEDMIRKIDFANGDVNRYLEHLAKALADQYEGALRFASTNTERDFYKATDGKWYVDNEAYEEDWDTGEQIEGEMTTYGPFPSFKAAEKWMDRNFANSGAYSMDDSGRARPPRRPVKPRGRWASERTAFNKYDPDELMGQLIYILKKEGLRDEASRVKGLQPVIQKAWRSREQ